jgi:hypothetical protein
MAKERPRRSAPRAHERDERWALVALVVLAVAYAVYRAVGSGAIGLPEIRLKGLDLSRLARAGAAIPYAATVIIGVLVQLVKRARYASARRELEQRAAREGVVASAEKAVWRERSADGNRGKARTGRLTLSRAALYFLDSKSGESIRLPFTAGEPGVPAIAGATTRRGERGVTIELMLQGQGAGAIELGVADVPRWIAALSTVAGRRIEPSDEPTDDSEHDDQDDDANSKTGWMAALGV